jgi:hypothetical protein
MDDLETFGSEVGHGFQQTIAVVHEALGNGFECRDEKGVNDDNQIVFSIPSLEDVLAVESELTQAWKKKKLWDHACICS